MNDAKNGAFAETLMDPKFREAANTAFYRDTESYRDQQSVAERIVIDALSSYNRPSEVAFEETRLAALELVYGNERELGPFKTYFQQLEGKSDPIGMSEDEIEPARLEVKQTNDRVKGFARVYEDPIDFLSNTNEMLQVQTQRSKKNVGPGNYATSLKFFTDKYNDFPSSNLDETKLRDVVTSCLQGFDTVTRKEQPNFIEMTNVYVAARDLPAGTFEPQFSKMIVMRSLEQLPTFHHQTLSILLGAMAKLDLRGVEEPAAMLVDLSMRKMRSFESTRDMRRALRSIANLPPSDAANHTFKTFVELRNNLEEPLDLAGIDETNARLLHIVESVIDDLELIPVAKDLAFKCTERAVAMYKHAQNRGALTQPQLAGMKQTVERIVSNFTQM